jgi:hypothetical protein
MMKTVQPHLADAPRKKDFPYIGYVYNATQYGALMKRAVIRIILVASGFMAVSAPAVRAQPACTWAPATLVNESGRKEPVSICRLKDGTATQIQSNAYSGYPQHAALASLLGFKADQCEWSFSLNDDTMSWDCNSPDGHEFIGSLYGMPGAQTLSGSALGHGHVSVYDAGSSK